MTYQVKSTVDFKRMRELFFAKDNYTLSGEGRFNGVFHLFKGGRALTGDFESDLAGLQIGGHDYEFPDLKGKLGWYPNRFEVTDTTTGFYGGEASLKYSILSSGKPGAAVEREVRRRVAGRRSGRLQRFPSHGGRAARRPMERPQPARVADGPFPRTIGRRLLGSDSAGGRRSARRHPARASSRADPIAAACIRRSATCRSPGEVTYRYDQDWLEFSDGRFSTPATDVTFSGRTAWGDNSRIPFHVTSTDLQESDRVLAGMMTAFGAPTNPITVGGTAEFSGVMTEALNRPRVEGHFVAEDMRAFDVNWGEGEAGLVIQNSYVDVTGGRMQKDGGEIVVNGRFSLGFPRRDKGEEINGRIRVDEVDGRRLQARLRHRRLRRRGHGVGRISPLRAVSGPVRVRHADDRRRHRLRRAVRDRDRARCASRETACASTASRCRRAAAPPKARRSSAGTAPIRSTRPAAAFRWRASRRWRIRRRRSRACSSSTPTAPARSKCRATSSAAASATCSSPTKAWAK